MLESRVSSFTTPAPLEQLSSRQSPKHEQDPSNMHRPSGHAEDVWLIGVLPPVLPPSSTCTNGACTSIHCVCTARRVHLSNRCSHLHTLRPCRISTLGALSPPRRARPGPCPHTHTLAPTGAGDAAVRGRDRHRRGNPLHPKGVVKFEI